METVQRSLAQQGYIRTGERKLFAGVCSSLAAKWHTDPWAVRVLFAFAVMLVHPLWLLYFVGWVAIPDQARAAQLLASTPHAEIPAASPVATPQDQAAQAQYPL